MKAGKEGPMKKNFPSVFKNTVKVSGDTKMTSSSQGILVEGKGGKTTKYAPGDPGYDAVKQTMIDAGGESPMALRGGRAANPINPRSYERAYRAEGSGPMPMKKAPMKQAKPDFPDIDGDGNTKESMKKAAADKKSAKKMKKAPMKLKKAPTKMKKKSSMKMGHKSPKKLSQATMNPAQERTGRKPSASIRMKKTAPKLMAKKSPKKIRRGGSGVAERVLPGGKNR